MVGRVLGISASDAFKALVVDGYFEGPKAMEVNGGPVPMDPDGYHIDNTISFEGEEVLMDTGTGYGYRKWPTRLDLALLEDIGYTVVY